MRVAGLPTYMGRERGRGITKLLLLCACSNGIILRGLASLPHLLARCQHQQQQQQQQQHLHHPHHHHHHPHHLYHHHHHHHHHPLSLIQCTPPSSTLTASHSRQFPVLPPLPFYRSHSSHALEGRFTRHRALSYTNMASELA